MNIIAKLFLALTIFNVSCNGQGAPWTPEETLNIYNKLYFLASRPSQVINQYVQLYPEFDFETYTEHTRPNAPKMLRLGFHDCIPYADAKDGELTGCDGCLNSHGMLTNVLEYYNTDANEYNAPNLLETDNNGLMFTADVLEEIYTNPHFPQGVTTEALPMSMKESGKSRADLWAFAALVASKYGIDNNNLACAGEPRTTCGYVYHFESDCTLEWDQPPPFKTGRKDCTPDPNLSRPFITLRPEIHPNVQGNGPETVDYYSANFNFTAREAIALMEGAHAFGTFNLEISMRPYSWTREQQRLLNNQMFRNAASRPQYYMDCDGSEDPENFLLVGDVHGNVPDTTWRVKALGFQKDGGPFHWFHTWDRCPSQQECDTNAEGITPKTCCQNLDDGKHCQASCQRLREGPPNRETALAVDIGLYQKFETDPETGKPFGCPGFDTDWMSGRSRRSKVTKCEKEDYAPEGETLFSIMDDYADNAQKWMDDFFVVLDKMSSNGYNGNELNVNPFNVGDFPTIED